MLEDLPNISPFFFFFYFSFKFKSKKPGVTHQYVAMHQKRQKAAASTSAPHAALPSPWRPSQTLKYTRLAACTLCSMCTQTVCFLSIQNWRFPWGKTFLQTKWTQTLTNLLCSSLEQTWHAGIFLSITNSGIVLHCIWYNSHMVMEKNPKKTSVY